MNNPPTLVESITLHLQQIMLLIQEMDHCPIQDTKVLVEQILMAYHRMKLFGYVTLENFLDASAEERFDIDEEPPYIEPVEVDEKVDAFLEELKKQMFPQPDPDFMDVLYVLPKRFRRALKAELECNFSNGILKGTIEELEQIAGYSLHIPGCGTKCHIDIGQALSHWRKDKEHDSSSPV